jgi:hypothetical protein
MDAKDPILPIDRIDPVLPIDSIDPRDPIDSIDPCERSESSERVGMSNPFVRIACPQVCPRARVSAPAIP